MKIVGIRELKDRLSEYLRHVRQQGPVYVSNRGEIVAEMRATYGSGAAVGREVPEGIRELADEGGLRVGTPNDPALYPTLKPALKGATAAELLDEERA